MSSFSIGNLLKRLAISKTINANTWENLEDTLLQADVSLAIAEQIIHDLKKAKLHKKSPIETLQHSLKDILTPFACQLTIPPYHNVPFSIMVVGTNGVGKTSLISKIACHYKKQGLSIMLIAADTFRAAASEQLACWAKRLDVPIISEKQGANPSAVIYSGIQAAISKKIDLVIIDSAGRQNNNQMLMQELKKMQKVASNFFAPAQKITLLTLDAESGKNGVIQAEGFAQHIDIDGIALTKLDGTAKGGSLITLAHSIKKPIYFLSQGENIEALSPLIVDDFIKHLLADTATEQES